MSYSKLFEQNRVCIHRKAVSTKILDSIHRLMMEVNENSPRRWVWELIQNAGDAAQGEEVEIFIHLKRDGEVWRLEFSHNGRPFNVLTLTSLVNQVSGKERGPREEGRESTGRFGTGFMTTHLLSRKVEVRSVIQEQGEDCKRFRILLDRSGTTLREIEEGLDLALGELEGLDLVPDCRDSRERKLNTVFSYLLDEAGSGDSPGRNPGFEGKCELYAGLWRGRGRHPTAGRVERGGRALPQDWDGGDEEGGRMPAV